VILLLLELSFRSVCLGLGAIAKPDKFATNFIDPAQMAHAYDIGSAPELVVDRLDSEGLPAAAAGREAGGRSRSTAGRSYACNDDAVPHGRGSSVAWRGAHLRSFPAVVGRSRPRHPTCMHRAKCRRGGRRLGIRASGGSRKVGASPTEWGISRDLGAEVAPASRSLGDIQLSGGNRLADSEIARGFGAQAELVHAVAHGVAGQAQETPGLGHVPAGPLQGL
jgi:hypothetical protein